MKRRLYNLTLLLCGALVLTPAAGAVSVPAASRTALNCHEMAKRWFGASLLEAEEPGSPAAAASAWFARREADYLGPGAVVLPETAALLDAEPPNSVPGEISDEENPNGELPNREIPNGGIPNGEIPDGGIPNGGIPSGEISDEELSDTEEAARSARLDAIVQMQERLEIAVTDADVTAQVDDSRTQTNPDGTVTLYVYEWTFLDYDDLTDGPGGLDVAGFGTWHKLTMEPVGDGWRTIRDEYDEEDFLGVNTVTAETRASGEAALLLADHLDGAEPGGIETSGIEPGGIKTGGTETGGIKIGGTETGGIKTGGTETGGIKTGGAEIGVTETGVTETGVTETSVTETSVTETKDAEDLNGTEAALLDASPFYAGYDPDAAAAYADKYAMSYNPAWPNYNPVGGDCANFTSQSLYAGNMPMVQGSSGWYHKLNSTSTSSARSGSWTFARELYKWMGANRGVAMTAADDTVIKGSPVFYVNKGKTTVGHAVICVGTNSAGRPIIDGHNNDMFHAPWNYSKSAPAVYTVQLTGDIDLPLSIAGERYPSGNMAAGAGFGLRGVIRSSAVVTRVTADVLDASGTPLPDLHYEEDWNDYRYDIRTDGLNDAMVFDPLPPGKYTYVVRAEDADGASEELIRSGFEVMASEITLTGETYPTGVIKKGNSFRLEGVIQSNLPLRKIRAYVFDSSGNPVSDKFVYERNWSAESYNIRSDGINSAFVFNNLDAGSYVYTVTVTDAAGSEKTVIEAPFAVSAFTASPETPSIGVIESSVYFSWSALEGAESYQAVLSSPETGEPLYTATVTQPGAEPSVVLENVAAGTYDACVIALAGEESRQSDTLSIAVADSNPGVVAEVSPKPSITVERVYRDSHRITITSLLTGGAAGSAHVAAAAYRDSRFICTALKQVTTVAEDGQQQVMITLNSPASAPFDNTVSVKLFLLHGDSFVPLSEAASTI